MKTRFRPLSRYGWVPTSPNDRKHCEQSVSGPSRGMGGVLPKDHALLIGGAVVFPAPLEVWVGSYYDFFKNYRTCA